MTRGRAGSGGDSSAVQAQLKNVQQIQATGSAFAAIPGVWLELVIIVPVVSIVVPFLGLTKFM